MCIFISVSGETDDVDMSAELPENERKRFAARAVRDMMKEI